MTSRDGGSAAHSHHFRLVCGVDGPELVELSDVNPWFLPGWAGGSGFAGAGRGTSPGDGRRSRAGPNPGRFDGGGGGCASRSGAKAFIYRVSAITALGGFLFGDATGVISGRCWTSPPSSTSPTAWSAT